MMRHSRVLMAGTARILLANAFVLASVAYNHSAVPESQLRLT